MIALDRRPGGRDRPPDGTVGLAPAGSPGGRAPALALLAALGLGCASEPPRSEPAPAVAQEPEASEPEADPEGGEPQEPSTSGSIPQTAAPAAEPKASGSSSPLHGSLTSVWRGRLGKSEHDNDLYGLLALDYGDSTRDKWTGHFIGRLAADLDGDGTGPFFQLDDTLGDDVDLRLYDAYAEGHGVGPLESLRLGRQRISDTPAFVWFDGARAETKPRGKSALQFGAWGGIPVHLYESGDSKDLVAGLYLQGRPWTGGRLRFDWMHLEDDDDGADHEDDLLGLSAWQSLGERLRLETSYTRLEGEDRDVSARATWSDAKDDLQLQASYYRLLETQEALALEIDPFFTTLFELFPYEQARLLASKRLGEKVGVQAGLDVRRVDDEDDEGLFNRDFERGFATLTLDEVLPSDVTLALTGEVWDGDGSDIETWGADLSRRFRDDLTASLGSYYALFKSDLFTASEREDVRTWYTRLRWKNTKSTTWDLRYEAEDTDFGWFHLLRLGLTWRF
ncbi:MAG TPA: hypothetical protein VMS76_20580 [Planctomycetota bacterium]|nr:hypothetical protein [Planctomycetota bacterium]